MCHQHFLVWSCGCRRIDEQECEAAQELELPFFQKVACSEYTSQHTAFPHACGIGNFYCNKGQDGEYLDHVHESKTLLQKELYHLIEKINTVFLPQKQRMVARLRATTYGDRFAVERFAREDPEAIMVQHLADQTMATRQHLQSHIDMANQIIYYSKQHYMLAAHAARSMGVPPVVPPLTPALRQFPAQISLSPPQRPPQQSTGSGPFLSAPQPARARPGSNGEPMGENIVVQRRRVTLDTVGAGLSNMQPAALAQAQTSVQDSPKKRGRPFKRNESRTEEKPPPSVRRSARVKDTKVNYAEHYSDVSSRDPSPAKSDLSTFSPPKSDASASPERQNTLRSAYMARLARGQTKPQSDMLSTASMQRRVQQAVTEQQRAFEGGTPSGSQRDGTPDTIIMSPATRNSAQAPQPPPSAFNPSVTPARHWPVNQGNGDPTQSPNPLNPLSLTAYGFSNPAHTGTPSQVPGHLQRQRSMNSPTVYETLPTGTPTNVDKDPRKRPLPQSSPGPRPSTKKMRLSLPGEDGVPVLQSTHRGKRALAASSPMQRRDSAVQLPKSMSGPVTPLRGMPDPFSTPQAQPGPNQDDFEDLEWNE